jgi:hypothetical protein
MLLDKLKNHPLIKLDLEPEILTEKCQGRKETIQWIINLMEKAK